MCRVGKSVHENKTVCRTSVQSSVQRIIPGVLKLGLQEVNHKGSADDRCGVLSYSVSIAGEKISMAKVLDLMVPGSNPVGSVS